MESLGKVKDVITSEHFGKIVKTSSLKYGKGLYMIIQENRENWYDKVRFVRLSSGTVNYWESMKNDEVLEIQDFPLTSLNQPV